MKIKILYKNTLKVLIISSIQAILLSVSVYLTQHEEQKKEGNTFEDVYKKTINSYGGRMCLIIGSMRRRS